MPCPRCGNEEFSSSGICPACNYKAVSPKAVANPDEKESGSLGPNRLENPRTANNSEEIPPWRLELKQRLEALKERKKAGGESNPAIKKVVKPAPKIVQSDSIKKPPAPPSENTGKVKKIKHPSEPRPETMDPGANAPQQKTIASLGEKVFQSIQSDNSKDIRDLIDSAVARQSTQSVSDASIYVQETPIEQENKYILLSRTLAGLVDLIIIVLCTTAFIIAADSFSGIVMLDDISIIEYTVLFLLIFFLYSIFFLSASGQTIGMMITDLRIIGIANSRPSIGQLFTRCFGYLLSVILLGAGLFWSFFDRKNRCFHDRLSDTSVKRI